MRRIKDKDLPLIWQLSWKLALLCLVIFAVGCFFTNPLEWGCGRAVGLRFHRGAAVHDEAKRGGIGPDGAGLRPGAYARAQYVVRYFLSAAVLIAAALIPWINVIAAGLSMIALKLVTYIQGWLDKRYYPDEPDKFVEWEEESDEDQDWDRWGSLCDTLRPRQTAVCQAEGGLPAAGGRWRRTSRTRRRTGRTGGNRRAAVAAGRMGIGRYTEEKGVSGLSIRYC